MSDFPKGGDIEATRAWLDKKGFVGLLNGWKAEALMGVPNVNLLIRALGNNEGEGIRLWSLLNSARQTPSPDLADERPTKIPRVEGPVEFNMRVRCLTRQIKDVTGETLEIDGVPNAMTDRYSLPKTLSLYCRKSYSSLYSYIKNEILDEEVTRPVMLVSGVPGIGKSLFSIYFMIQMMMDESFPVKECFFEYESGEYDKFTLINRNLTTVADPTSQVKWTAELRFRAEKFFQLDCATDLLLSDIKAPVEPRRTGRWTCIFSSPNPNRYKETMKAPHNYHLTMPTWSEQELQFVDENIDNWYDRFVMFGGVPRSVLWSRRGSDPLLKLQGALESIDAKVIDYLFHRGHCGLDPETSYMLIHINPPWIPEQDDWNYLDWADRSFASDAIFRTPSKKYEQKLLSESINLLNAREASEVYGGGFAGNVFEKVVMWLKPIAGQTITLRSLTDRTELVLTLPPYTLLSRNWKWSTNTDKLSPGCLYQPRISNLESGDCFGIVEHNGTFVLVVLQMTVSKKHPIKANGLRDIVSAYPLDVQNALSKKLVGFVIPTPGDSLDSVQPLHTRDGKVLERIPTELEGFEQYVCEYKISNVSHSSTDTA